MVQNRCGRADLLRPERCSLNSLTNLDLQLVACVRVDRFDRKAATCLCFSDTRGACSTRLETVIEDLRWQTEAVRSDFGFRHRGRYARIRSNLMLFLLCECW